MLTLWHRRFGFARPVAGLSHDVGFRWPLRWLISRIGGIRASPASAKGLLCRGFDVLVFPGGFFDALRPFGARYEVHWNARSGFVRTAAEASVFIVPIVNCGSHAQYTFLPGGKQVARLLGLTRLKIGTWPIPLGMLALIGVAVAWIGGTLAGRWALLALIAALIPNPTRMDLRFLPAVDSKALLRQHKGDWAAAAEEIRSQMEQQLKVLAERRLTPWG
jgi:1-acyl-sn-glycerol-3-phosphate acyltransferase